MLRVKLLNPDAKAPTVAHPGEDLGYDIYSAVALMIPARGHATVSTGIAIECSSPSGEKMGALLRDKSSMASRRLTVTGGVGTTVRVTGTTIGVLPVPVGVIVIAPW